MFRLDERLQQTTYHLASLPLSELLLSKNAAWPWYILVPRVETANDLVDLNSAQQQQFLRESNALSRWIKTYHQPDSLNVAALGNVVAQLHVHHVARFGSDPAWPDPIWGKPFSDDYIEETVTSIKASVTKYLL